MKSVIGDIVQCERIYDIHRNTSYWNASARFFVNRNEYVGYINVSSHKYAGQKIIILYNPKNSNDFISQSSTFSGITMIVFGIVFLIPKLKNRQKIKENT